jgi:hypothetical protein
LVVARLMKDFRVSLPPNAPEPGEQLGKRRKFRLISRMMVVFSSS